MKKIISAHKFGVQALACLSIVLLAATGYGAGIEIPANVVTRLGDVETLADANTAANTTEVARATAAEEANTASTTTEVARATAAEEANTASITTEVARATAAEEANTASITTEVARATAAEEANTASITTEVARATAAEEANTASITTEVARATAAEEVNTESITTEVARAESAEAALQPLDADLTELSDSDRFAILGPDATTSLMIQHGTNTLSSGTYAFTFDVPFAALPVTVLVQYTADPGSATNRVYAASVTTNGFTATGDSDVEVGFIAIGTK